MYTFTGSSRVTRNINLGGVNKTAMDSKTLMQRAMQERQRRSEERATQIAGLRILRSCRNLLARSHTCAGLRVEWDSLLRQQPHVSIGDLARMLRIEALVTRTDTRTDVDRIATTHQVLAALSESDVDALLRVLLASDSPAVNSRVFNGPFALQKHFMAAIEVLSVEQRVNAVALAHTFSQRATQLVSNGCTVHILPVNSIFVLAARMLNTSETRESAGILIERLVDHLREATSASSSSSSSSSSNTTAPQWDSTAGAFITYILTIPNLKNVLRNSQFATVVTRSPWRVTFALISALTDSDIDRIHQALNGQLRHEHVAGVILANLAQVVQSVISSKPSVDVLVLCFGCIATLARLVPHVAITGHSQTKLSDKSTRTGSDNDDDDDDDDEDEDIDDHHNADVLLGGHFAREFESLRVQRDSDAMDIDNDNDDGAQQINNINGKVRLRLDSGSRQQLAKYSSAKFISRVLKAASVYNNSELIMSIIDILLVQCLQWGNQIASRVFHAIAYDADNSSLLATLWTIVRNSSLWTHIDGKQLTLPSVFGDSNHYFAWCAFLLLIEIYHRILSSSGDDEFFDKQSTWLPLDSAVEICEAVRNIAASFVLNGESILRTLPNKRFLPSPRGVSSFITAEKLAASTLRCSALFYARDARRSFCPTGHWLLPAFISGGSLQANSPVIKAFFDNVSVRTVADSAESPNIHQQNQQQQQQQHQRLKPNSSDVERLIPLLTHMPYVVPFDTRASLFRALVSMDQAGLHSSSSSSLFHGRYNQGISAKVRRSRMLEDGLVAYGKLHGADFKQDFYIQFYDDFGMREWGIDGGGLFKEFVVNIVREAFNPSNQLFWETADHLLYPNSSISVRQSSFLNLYNFLGRLVGKSLYSNILIDAQFALFFLSKMLGHQSQFDDLKSLDKALYDGLVLLKRYENDVESDFGLTFAVSSLVMNDPLNTNTNTNQQSNSSSNSNSVVTTDLIPGGSDINVTGDNRFRYIELMCNHRLNVELSPQTRAFRQGLYEIIPQRWLRLFADPHELQMLISGKSAEIDVTDMDNNTVYGNDYNRNHAVIEMFWNVVRNRLTSTERRKLVQFITSCERPPLMGFSELKPSIQIVPDHGAESAEQSTTPTAANTSRLPTASTCINQLRLPAYASEDVMYQKLRRAILSGAGFDLS